MGYRALDAGEPLEEQLALLERGRQGGVLGRPPLAQGTRSPLRLEEPHRLLTHPESRRHTAQEVDLVGEEALVAETRQHQVAPRPRAERHRDRGAVSEAGELDPPRPGPAGDGEPRQADNEDRLLVADQGRDLRLQDLGGVLQPYPEGRGLVG